MESPVFVVAANLVMEDAEQKALNLLSRKLPIWKRYIDDTFTIVQHDMLINLDSHLNSIKPSIRFTMEVEENGILPFLDVTVTRHEDINLSTSVYKKSTPTDQYLHFQSNHPSEHKWSVLQTLLDQAKIHSSSTANRKEEERITETMRRMVILQVSLNNV